MDHLGSGREWDLLRKNGGLSIFPPYAEKNMKVYSGRVEALESILPFLKNKKEKYVIMTDANIAVDFDFNAYVKGTYRERRRCDCRLRGAGDPGGADPRGCPRGHVLHVKARGRARETDLHEFRG